MYVCMVPIWSWIPILLYIQNMNIYIYMHSMGYNVYFWVYMCDLTMHIIASPLNKKLFCPKFETEKCIDKP